MPAPYNLALTFLRAHSLHMSGKYISRPSTLTVDSRSKNRAADIHIALREIQRGDGVRATSSCKFIFGYLFILRKHIEKR